MNSNAISIRKCGSCRKTTLCARVLSVTDTQVNMCYACITRTFDRRIEKELDDELVFLIPEDEEEGYDRQMEAAKGK